MGTTSMNQSATEVYTSVYHQTRFAFDPERAKVWRALCRYLQPWVDLQAGSLDLGAGYGDFFIHRTGHGIGMEEHEDPYIVEGNTLALVAGHAYSVEPGIYIPGKWGMRLEDIVVATQDGPVALNNSVHDLVSVDA